MNEEVGTLIREIPIRGVLYGETLIFAASYS